jgi:hypothetical protein
MLARISHQGPGSPVMGWTVLYMCHEHANCRKSCAPAVNPVASFLLWMLLYTLLCCCRPSGTVSDCRSAYQVCVWLQGGLLACGRPS